MFRAASRIEIGRSQTVAVTPSIGSIGTTNSSTSFTFPQTLILKASEMSDAEIPIVLCGVKCLIFFVQHVNLQTANQRINSIFYSYCRLCAAEGASLAPPGDTVRGSHHPSPRGDQERGVWVALFAQNNQFWGLNSAPLLNPFSSVLSGIIL